LPAQIPAIILYKILMDVYASNKIDSACLPQVTVSLYVLCRQPNLQKSQVLQKQASLTWDARSLAHNSKKLSMLLEIAEGNMHSCPDPVFIHS